MKKKITRIIWHILTLACMACIFYLSSQDSGSSSKMSGEFIGKLANIFVGDFKNMTESQQMLFISGAQRIVRKYAHFFIYSVLGFFTMGTMYTYKMNLKSKLLTALAVVFLYAVSDEIHQIFVPGRSCEVRDVLIDTAGATLGILFMTTTTSLCRSSRRRRGQTDV